jgi:hypothetical protein
LYIFPFLQVKNFTGGSLTGDFGFFTAFGCEAATTPLLTFAGRPRPRLFCGGEFAGEFIS